MNRFDELEAFVQIVRAGSITGAARRLNIAKSAVSRRLSDLEARLGVLLFNRTTRKLSLTDAGQNLFIRAVRVLEDLDEAEIEAGAAQAKLVGKLKIAAPLSFGLKHLQPAISHFVRRHPQIDLEIDFSDRRVDLIEEGVDLAVRIGVLTDSSLIARKLCEIRAVVAAAPEFWRRHGRPIHPRDLESLSCVRYSNLARPSVANFWGPRGEAGSLSLDIKMLANNGEFLTDMAIDGHGFLIEPTFFIADHLKSGALEIALPSYAWSDMNLYVVYPPTRRLSARVRALVDHLAERFADNPYWDETVRAHGGA